MKVCDLCRVNPALEAEEIRTDTIAVLKVDSLKMLRITNAKSRRGLDAEQFEEIETCVDCLASVLREGKHINNRNNEVIEI